MTRPDQTRPDQTRPDQTRPDQTRPDQTRPDQKKSGTRSVNKINVPNRTIFCNDNLEVLQGINSDCIDLVYLDPPFNKKKVFTAPIGSSAEGASFKDIFTKEDVKEDWIKTIEEDNNELHSLLEGVKMMNGGGKSYNYWYLVYMAMRLIECHRVLKETGSLYLHCDPTMSHYLKLLLDCIFGEKSFVNEIVWCYSKWRNESKNFSTNHDIVFFYSKTENYTFNLQYQEEINKDKQDDLKRGYHSQGKRLLVYDANSVRAKEKINSGLYEKIVYIKEKNLKGSPVPDYWNIPSLRSSKSVERTGYPTQKPLALLRRIIEASSNEKDIVLDPFCGCATTCVTAEKLNRRWVGIDISVKAYELVKTRITKEVSNMFNTNKIGFQTDPPKRTDQGKNYVDSKYVYIVENSDNVKLQGWYKVGISSNPERRIQSAFDPQGSNKVIYKVKKENYRETERYIHKTYQRVDEWVTDANLETLKKEINEYNVKDSEQLGLV